MTTDLTALRENYDRAALDETQVPATPVNLFEHWLHTALEMKLPEPYAFTLATASKAGEPAARTLLLRGCSEQGLLFYTNYGSEKGQHLAENPHAQMLFFWHQLEQQVRITGHVEKLSETESTAYFHQRPHDSQVGAWVSQPQSAVVSSRDEMEAQFASLMQTYPAGTEVPKPPQWGGYRLVPERFEFWQGRPNRMHDRVVYTRSHEDESNTWVLSRLYP